MRYLALALLLAGCVTDSATLSIEQGKWANYHDYIAGAGKLALADQTAPDSVKAAFAECVANRTIKFMTPAELTTLDAFARGNQAITIGEAKQMDRDIKARAGLYSSNYTSANIGLLSDTCPNDVPSFRQYLKL